MPQDKTQGTYITQEDIDTALATAPPPEQSGGEKPLFLDEADIVDSGPEGGSEEADYFGLLSKNDIEALLHGDLGELEGVSGQEAQEEIDTLLQATNSEEDTSEDSEGAGKKNMAQEDVERLMQEAGDEVGAGGEGEIAEAGDAVSQGDIDRLLMGALDESGDDVEEESGDDVEIAGESDEGGGVVSQDDLDRLLSDELEDGGQDVEADFSEAASVEPEPAPTILEDTASIEPEAESESGDDTESLISQSDLDQLLGGSQPEDDLEVPSSEPKSKSEHISQDDINRLLKESLDEAEDLLEEDAAGAEESDFQEPVILAADEEAQEPSPPDEKPQPVEKTRKTTSRRRRAKRVWKNRLVWAAAAGIVLVVSMTAMMMSSGPTETVSQPKVMTFSLNQAGDGPADATVFSDTRIRLPGFVVLAPPNSAAVTYVAADLTLDFSNAEIVVVVKENEAFVRDIIYGTISSELMTRDISAIDEASMELAIRKALGRIVAREAIGRIAFDRFSLV